MGSHLTKLETYDVTVQSLDSTFKMDTKLTKVNKSELLAIDNPHYDAVKAKYSHLAPISVNDNDKKVHLPIHVILSVGDYARIKTKQPPLVGESGEPVGEYTKLEGELSVEQSYAKSQLMVKPREMKVLGLKLYMFVRFRFIESTTLHTSSLSRV